MEITKGIKKMHPWVLSKQTAASKIGRLCSVALMSFLLVWSGKAVADPGEATATIETCTTSYTSPEDLIIENQAVLPYCRTTAFAKFTRTITLTSASIVGIDSDTTNHTKFSPYAASNTGEYWSNSGSSWNLNGYDEDNDGDNTNDYNITWYYDSAWLGTPRIKYNNGTTIVVTGIPVDGFFTKMTLWESTESDPFWNKEKGTTITKVSSTAAGATAVVQEFDIAVGDNTLTFTIDDSYPVEDTETTTYWLTFETGEDGGTNLVANDIRVKIEDLTVDIQPYKAAYNTVDYPDPDGLTGVLINTITAEAHAVDMMPMKNNTSDFTTSNLVGNSGYPPYDITDYLNSQLKYYTVNGLAFIEPSDDASKELFRTKEAVGDVQQELMGLNDPYPILGLNIAGTNGNEPDSGYTTQFLESVKLTIFVPEDSPFNPQTDLVNHLNNNFENITLWEDKNNNGVFDFEDEKISLNYGSIAANCLWTRGVFGDDDVNVEDTPYTFSDNGTATDTTDDYVTIDEVKYTIYTTTMMVQTKEDDDGNGTITVAPIENTEDGLPDFFICTTANPASYTVTGQPKYGSTFSISSSEITFTYKQSTYNSATPTVPDDETINLNFDTMTREAKIGFDVLDYDADYLEAEGFPDPVLMFNMVCSRNGTLSGSKLSVVDADNEINETLHKIKVRFTGDNFTPYKLAALSDDAASGVSLWKDGKGATGSLATTTVGMFDPRAGYNLTQMTALISDTCVPLNMDNLVWYFHDDSATNKEVLWDGTQTLVDAADYFYVELVPKSPVILYDDDLFYAQSDGTTKGTDRGMDYFIAIRGRSSGLDYSSKRGLDYGDKIKISVIPSKDFLFGYGDEAFDQTEDSSLNEMFKTVSTEVTATMPTVFSEPDNENGNILSVNNQTAVLGLDIIAPDLSSSSATIQTRTDTVTTSRQIDGYVDEVTVAGIDIPLNMDVNYTLTITTEVTATTKTEDDIVTTGTDYYTAISLGETGSTTVIDVATIQNYTETVADMSTGSEQIVTSYADTTVFAIGLIGSPDDMNVDGDSITQEVNPLLNNTTTVSTSGGDSGSTKTTTKDLSSTTFDTTTTPGSIVITTTDDISCHVDMNYYKDGIPVLG
ncbi:MAG: hypothetical protein WCS73_09085, partial [Lentisphaeria bacterium]